MPWNALQVHSRILIAKIVEKVGSDSSIYRFWSSKMTFKFYYICSLILSSLYICMVNIKLKYNCLKQHINLLLQSFRSVSS